MVKPGGLVATYMWDFETAPRLAAGLRGDEILRHGAAEPAGVDSSRSHHANDLATGRDAIGRTEVIRIQVAYSDFGDFWRSCNVPVGPSGNAVANLSPGDREDLKNICAAICRPPPTAASSTTPSQMR